MNKKLLYAFVAGSLLSLSSCKDFLDVTPASGFTPDYVFSSETEMKSLMTRIYSSMTEDIVTKISSSLMGGMCSKGVPGMGFKIFMGTEQTSNSFSSKANSMRCFIVSPIPMIIQRNTKASTIGRSKRTIDGRHAHNAGIGSKRRQIISPRSGIRSSII